MKFPDSLLRINSYSSDKYWSKSTWFLWIIYPIILLEFVFILSWMYTEQFDQIAYTSFQTDFFIAFNQSLSTFPDLLWLNMTYMGDGVVIFALFSIMLILRSQAWAAMFASILIASVLTNLGKLYFHMPRPAVFLDSSQINIIGEVLQGYTSLPSGHSITISFVIVSILATLFSDPQSIKDKILLTLGLCVLALFCVSRVAVGAHWPLDIIAGAGVGWLSALFGVTIARKYTTWWQCMLTGKRRFFLIGLLLLLSVALILRSFHEVLAMPILISAALVALYVSFVIFKYPVVIKDKG